MEVETIEWLHVPDLVELFGISPGRIRRLIEDRHIVAKRVDGVLRIPALFVENNEPLPELRGTVILLNDQGFSDDDVVDWLIEVDDRLGTSPILALRAGRKAEVRRVASVQA